ncbi:MAG: hypothetical protein LBC73_09195 [Oscillospiraceae bacterium]|jgi:hypothetical protein|nr:hypothetical protein [Oscillospiraceae bacterium]
MQAQVYEGYFIEQDKFVPQGTVKIPLNKRTLVTIFDEQPVQNKTIKKRLNAIDKFIKSINLSDEDVPDFERVGFKREVNL